MDVTTRNCGGIMPFVQWTDARIVKYATSTAR